MSAKQLQGTSMPSDDQADQSRDVSPPSVPAQLGEAIQVWRKLLGEEHVLETEQQCSLYGESTLPRTNHPVSILRPASKDEVVDVVAVASKFGVPLYPISRGKNWGYGDATPTTAGQVIVDLARMNRVVELNNELAYAVIEPGVTQGQLADEIERSGFDLMLDVTGAGPEASIVGNTLERGFGHTPYGDHFAHSGCFEVVLGDGKQLTTGFGGFADPQAAHVFPSGWSASLDGLFTQSNFGIVTRMTISLMRRPANITAFALQLKHDQQLEEVVEVLRDVRQLGIVRSTVHVANDLRVISSLTGCPDEARQRHHAIDRETRERLRRETGTGAWNLLGGLYGDAGQVAWARRELRRRFKHLARPIFFDRRRLELWQRAARPLLRFASSSGVKAKLASAESALDMLSGRPTREHLRGAFWRNSLPANSSDNPIHAGLIWISPVIPMIGRHARDLMSLVEPIMRFHGFDPLTTLTAINERALCGVISINFDRADSEEASRAQLCYEELQDTLTSHGYFPYRSGTQSMSFLGKLNGNTEVLNQIKQVVDPQGIIAPGRYGIG